MDASPAKQDPGQRPYRLGARVPAEDASGDHGHASGTTTLDLYGHLWPGEMDRYADRLDSAADDHGFGGHSDVLSHHRVELTGLEPLTPACKAGPRCPALSMASDNVLQASIPVSQCPSPLVSVVGAADHRC